MCGIVGQAGAEDSRGKQVRLVPTTPLPEETPLSERPVNRASCYRGFRIFDFATTIFGDPRPFLSTRTGFANLSAKRSYESAILSNRSLLYFDADADLASSASVAALAR